VTFSSNCVSLEIFEAAHEMRLQAQMRPTLDGLIPISAAIVARLQYVAWVGLALAVFVSTASFTASASGDFRE
jgi:hypothetical protein